MQLTDIKKGFYRLRDWIYYLRFSYHSARWSDLSSFFPRNSPLKFRMFMFIWRHDNKVSQGQIDDFLKKLEQESVEESRMRALMSFKNWVKEGNITANPDGSYSLQGKMGSNYTFQKTTDLDLKLMIFAVVLGELYWATLMGNWIFQTFSFIIMIVTLIAIVDEYRRTIPF
jgi:flagellar biosynthesis protein FliP